MNPAEHYRIDAEVFDYWGEDQFSPAIYRRNQYSYWLAGLRPGEKVLDIGSGRGWFSFYAQKQGAEVTALDLSEVNLSRIRETEPRIRTLLTDAAEPQTGGETYDLIVALEVLEHIEDPEKALTNWYSLLRPGGRLMISVPYKEQIRYSLCVHCNQKTPHNAHLHSFDRDKLSAILHRAGFRVSRSCLFSHKLLTHLRLEGLLRHLPFAVWRVLDGLCGLLGDKYNYLAVICEPRKER